MPQFERYIGIDYSGAKTPTESLRGLRVYAADWVMPPREVPPPPSPRKYWTRRGLAEWLVAQLSGGKPMLVGIDHGFSFPLAYFEKHQLAHDWPKFLDDFQKHWPTDAEHTYVDFVRDGFNGNGAARAGNSRWRRLTELRAGSAKSVFHFDCQGSVAKSTHAGLPWLRFIRQRCGDGCLARAAGADEADASAGKPLAQIALVGMTRRQGMKEFLPVFGKYQKSKLWKDAPVSGI